MSAYDVTADGKLQIHEVLHNFCVCVSFTCQLCPLRLNTGYFIVIKVKYQLIKFSLTSYQSREWLSYEIMPASSLYLHPENPLMPTSSLFYTIFLFFVPSLSQTHLFRPTPCLSLQCLPLLPLHNLFIFYLCHVSITMTQLVQKNGNSFPGLLRVKPSCSEETARWKQHSNHLPKLNTWQSIVYTHSVHCVCNINLILMEKNLIVFLVSQQESCL